MQWYLAEALQDFKISEPGSLIDLETTLTGDILAQRSPYPQLQLYHRVYNFESQTTGTYESAAGKSERTTWDYWDDPHLWNLALEAWSDGKLVVYSTRTVQPADFDQIQSAPADQATIGDRTDPIDFYANSAGGYLPSSTVRRLSSNVVLPGGRALQLGLAWLLTIAGFFLMISGL